MSSQPLHALVLGASGISGWAVLNQLRSYPTPETFTRTTGTTNRPLTLEKAQIPPDARIKLVNGIDFTKTVEEACVALKEKIADVASVTHVFFTAYVHVEEFQALKDINNHLLQTAITALDRLSPNLQSVILQTGGKGYGLEFPSEVKITPPLQESMPRIPPPWSDNIFYYSQYDIVQSLARGKNWTFTEVRPDGIIGFVPGSNAMNLAQGIALYLTMYAAVNGKGAKVPFPGSEQGWKSTHSDTSQDILAKMEIHAALNPAKCGGGGVFNIADGKVVTWAGIWPRLCDYFGLVGAGPLEGSEKIEDFVRRNEKVWGELVRKEGIREASFQDQNWPFVHFMMVTFDFDREYDLSRARESGFEEEIDTAAGYFVAFERMKKAGILPA